MFVTRATLLMESNEFPEQNAQLIRFLDRPQFTHLFAYQQCLQDTATGQISIEQKDSCELKSKSTYIKLGHLNLRRARLGSLDIKSSEWTCSDMGGAEFSNTDLSDSEMWYVDLREAFFVNTNLRAANISWANLKESNFDWVNLQGAIILFSDLTHLQSMVLPAEIDDKERDEYFAKQLSKARSLYGSLLDEGVETALIRLMSPIDYQNLRYDPLAILEPQSYLTIDLDVISFSNKQFKQKLSYIRCSLLDRVLKPSWESEWDDLRNTRCPKNAI